MSSASEWEWEDAPVANVASGEVSGVSVGEPVSGVLPHEPLLPGAPLVDEDSGDEGWDVEGVLASGNVAAFPEDLRPEEVADGWESVDDPGAQGSSSGSSAARLPAGPPAPPPRRVTAGGTGTSIPRSPRMSVPGTSVDAEVPSAPGGVVPTGAGAASEREDPSPRVTSDQSGGEDPSGGNGASMPADTRGASTDVHTAPGEAGSAGAGAQVPGLIEQMRPPLEPVGAPGVESDGEGDVFAALAAPQHTPANIGAVGETGAVPTPDMTEVAEVTEVTQGSGAERGSAAGGVSDSAGGGKTRGAAGSGKKRKRGPEAPTNELGQRKRRAGSMVISGQIDMPGGVRLTARDYQLLAFLGRYKVATVTQIARYFRTSETAMRNRLPRLERAGLLGWAYTGQAKPKAWTVTETGLKVAGVALSPPQIKWGTLRHTFGLVDLGVTFEHAGETVVTEREIRAAAREVPTTRLHGTLVQFGEEAEVADTYIIPIKGRQLGHIPDMVLARPPYPSGASGFVAVELELYRKSLNEWKTTLTAFRDTALYDQVVYYTPDPDIVRALNKQIKALSAQHRITVERFTPLETAADPTIHTRLG